MFFPSKFQEDERPAVSYLRQETAHSHVVLAAAQRSWKAAANKFWARLAGAARLHRSSLAQHANAIPSPSPLHHVSCNVARKHSSQRLSACAGHRFLRQGSGCRRSLSSSLTCCPLGDTPNALTSTKSLQPGPLLEPTPQWAAVKKHTQCRCATGMSLGQVHVLKRENLHSFLPCFV